jgi:curved DNA-binding protein CbpA
MKNAFLMRTVLFIHHLNRHASASASVRAESAARFKLITEAYELLSDGK